MCHIVRASKAGYFFPLVKEKNSRTLSYFLIGSKTMNLERGFSFLFQRERRPIFKKSKLGLILKSDKPVLQQEVLFKLPTADPFENPNVELTFEVATKIKAGLHASPVKTTFTDEGEERFLVLFSADDITFYDGHDVSAKKFLIPWNFKASFEECESLEEMFVSGYKTFIETFERQSKLLVELRTQERILF